MPTNKMQTATGSSREPELERDDASSSVKEEEEEEASGFRRFLRRLVGFYWANEFLILIVAAILLARAYPPLAAVYVAPEITADWIAVVFIFLLSGLNLKTSEFTYAFKQIFFNVFVQVYSFLVVSAVVYGVSRGVARAGLVSQDLADGMVICACLPMAITMGNVLTRASGGEEAAAIFNAAFSNLAGVFISPALILAYLGAEGDIDLLSVFYKLALKVLLPIGIGQLLQKFSKSAVAFVEKYKVYFGKAQQYCLVFIVYTVFGKTFSNGTGESLGSIFFLILFQLMLLVGLMMLAWCCLRLLFRDKPKLCVMGIFGCTQKTAAVGLPLIGAIYGNNPAVGLYTLPLIIWHPLQLIFGTALVPKLVAFVERENERLGIKSDEDDKPSSDLESADRLVENSNCSTEKQEVFSESETDN